MTACDACAALGVIWCALLCVEWRLQDGSNEFSPTSEFGLHERFVVALILQGLVFRSVVIWKREREKERGQTYTGTRARTPFTTVLQSGNLHQHGSDLYCSKFRAAGNPAQQRVRCLPALSTEQRAITGNSKADPASSRDDSGACVPSVESDAF